MKGRLKRIEKEFRKGRDHVCHAIRELTGVRAWEKSRRRHKWRRIRAAEADAVKKAREETARQLELAKQAVASAQRPAGAVSSSPAGSAFRQEVERTHELVENLEKRVEGTNAAIRDMACNVRAMHQLASDNAGRLGALEGRLTKMLSDSQEAAYGGIIVEEEEEE